MEKGKGKQKPSNEPSRDGSESISIRVVNRCRNSLSKNILIVKVQSIVVLKSEDDDEVMLNVLGCQMTY